MKDPTKPVRIDPNAIYDDGVLFHYSIDASCSLAVIMIPDTADTFAPGDFSDC